MKDEQRHKLDTNWLAFECERVKIDDELLKRMKQLKKRPLRLYDMRFKMKMKEK